MSENEGFKGIFLGRFRGFAHVPGDSDEVTFEKVLILVLALSCMMCGLAWSLMYWAVFGVGLTMALPALFVVIVGTSIIISALISDHRPVIYAQLACITWISAFIQWSIGSSSAAGLVISWSSLGPIGALLFLSHKHAVFWMAQFLFIIGISVFFEPALLNEPLYVAESTQNLFFAMNVGVSLSIVFAVADWFVRTIQFERERSERLLATMLPDMIARRLKNGEDTIADAHGDVSVLFADIYGFTDYSATVPPEQLVSELNSTFERFDHLVRAHGLEKIKTIGDAYMVASGVTNSRDDHAEALADFALELFDVLKCVQRQDGESFRVRVGIHSGPVIAGVIGLTKRTFDIWGDTVNTASRMESNGRVDRITISDHMAKVLSKKFIVEERGIVDVKGKGPMMLYFLGGRLSSSGVK